jgi:hypothetical protein
MTSVLFQELYIRITMPKKPKGVSHYALAIYIEKYLKAKEEL